MAALLTSPVTGLKPPSGNRQAARDLGRSCELQEALRPAAARHLRLAAEGERRELVSNSARRIGDGIPTPG